MVSLIPLVALTAAALSSIVNSSPVDSVGLSKRQYQVPPCRFVLRTNNDGDILELNIPQEIRNALTQALNDTSPAGVSITPSIRYELATNGDNTWSYAWAARINDPTTLEQWTADAVTEATEKLVGHVIKTARTTWAIESAGCDPLFTMKTTPTFESSDTIVSSGLEEQRQNAGRMVKRQEESRAECSFVLRPNEQDSLIGVELTEEAWQVYVRGIFDKNRGNPDLQGVGVTDPHYFARHTNGTWSTIQYPILYGPGLVSWDPTLAVKVSEELRGWSHKTASVGWTVESVNCRVVLV